MTLCEWETPQAPFQRRCRSPWIDGDNWGWLCRACLAGNPGGVAPGSPNCVGFGWHDVHDGFVASTIICPCSNKVSAPQILGRPEERDEGQRPRPLQSQNSQCETVSLFAVEAQTMRLSPEARKGFHGATFCGSRKDWGTFGHRADFYPGTIQSHWRLELGLRRLNGLALWKENRLTFSWLPSSLIEPDKVLVC